MWPFLYFADDRLSTPELMAARLDGHLIEVGEGFMPADAVETRELRAASLRRVYAPGLAFTHESAAWVHGALTEVPRRHCVQRTGARRRPPLLDRRLRYRDGRLADRDVVIVSGVAVTVPERTLADLVRDRVDSDDICVLGLRFTGDKLAPPERFASLRRELGENFIGVEIDSSPGNPWGHRRLAHSVLAEDLVDEPGQPTHEALEQVLQFLRDRLLAPSG